MTNEQVKVFKPQLKGRFITSTPIVLYGRKIVKIAIIHLKKVDFSFFLKRLKDNALKKYNAYYGLRYDFDGNLFDSFQFDREVAVRVKDK